MSDGRARILFKDGYKLYGYYRGSTDFFNSYLCKTEEDIYDCKKQGLTCNCVGEDVILYQDYANGEVSTGRACREHMYLTFSYSDWLESREFMSYEYNSSSFGEGMSEEDMEITRSNFKRDMTKEEREGMFY